MATDKCPHCGLIHETTCARIRAIEYYPDGVTVKRIELVSPAQEKQSNLAQIQEAVFRGRIR